MSLAVLLVNSYVIMGKNIHFCLVYTECLCRFPPHHCSFQISVSECRCRLGSLPWKIMADSLKNHRFVYYLRQMFSIEGFFLPIILNTVSLHFVLLFSPSPMNIPPIHCYTLCNQLAKKLGAAAPLSLPALLLRVYCLSRNTSPLYFLDLRISALNSFCHEART